MANFCEVVLAVSMGQGSAVGEKGKKRIETAKNNNDN